MAWASELPTDNFSIEQIWESLLQTGLWVQSIQKLSSSIFPTAFSLTVSTCTHTLIELELIEFSQRLLTHIWLYLCQGKRKRVPSNSLTFAFDICCLIIRHPFPSCGNNLDFYLGILLSPLSVRLACLRLYSWPLEAHETSTLTSWFQLLLVHSEQLSRFSFLGLLKDTRFFSAGLESERIWFLEILAAIL